MAKIAPATLQEAIKSILAGSAESKRAFHEIIDLQVNLKNYDTAKDKRFSGSLRLPNLIRPNYKVAIICDLIHEEVGKKAQLNTLNMDDLKKLNKNKKLVRRPNSTPLTWMT